MRAVLPHTATPNPFPQGGGQQTEQAVETTITVAGVALVADYAGALERLHAGMRKVDIPTPHFTDRVEQAQQLVASRDQTPALAEADRELLGDTLRRLRRAIGRAGSDRCRS